MLDRRTLLGTLAGSVSVAGCLDSAGLSGELRSVGVESLTWEGATLVLDMDETFDRYDGWTIHHEFEDPKRHRVASAQYPRTDEPFRMPFPDMLRQTRQTFSSRQFQITPFTGYFNQWSHSDYDSGYAFADEGPTVGFTAPEAAVPSDVRD